MQRDRMVDVGSNQRPGPPPQRWMTKAQLPEALGVAKDLLLKRRQAHPEHIRQDPPRIGIARPAAVRSAEHDPGRVRPGRAAWQRSGRWRHY